MSSAGNRVKIEDAMMVGDYVEVLVEASGEHVFLEAVERAISPEEVRIALDWAGARELRDALSNFLAFGKAAH